MSVAQDKRLEDGIAAGRLPAEEIADNFSDVHPPLDNHQALVAADRCYFCYDAPCVTACPTAIDIPLFIRQISTGNTLGAAETIFDQNILGGMCARVCPTETLCEQACVREEAEGKPVKIGLLQRFATDEAMSQNKHFRTRAKTTGKSIGVVGAGPAGLACAHRLAMYGHDVTIYEAKPKPGGLNEYGIAAYKTVDEFAQHEVDYVTAIGGIEIEYNTALGKDVTLADLRAKYDAVFLGMGLTGVNVLRVESGDLNGVEDAVDFIAKLRQTKDKRDIPVGRDVVVIGGGMTAVDCAVQAKLLGAENVTIAYRRGQENMNASGYEQELAATTGVRIRHNLQPIALHGEEGKVAGIELEYTAIEDGKLTGTGETLRLEADQVFRAIGQTFEGDFGGDDIDFIAGRIATVGAHGQTAANGVWAGGDCVVGDDDLTVTAVAQGRDAAEDIHAAFSS
ncbi:MAG: NAD(P)-dependent oxidoreductase [Rhizobiaceae bacterium]